MQTNLGSSGVEQFLAYLSDTRVKSLDNLVYVFNRKKIKEDAARNLMQTVFRLNAVKIFNSKPSLFNTISTSTGTLISTSARLEAFATNAIFDAEFKEKILYFVIANGND